MEIKDKVALVTGTRRIGSVVAVELARDVHGGAVHLDVDLDDGPRACARALRVLEALELERRAVAELGAREPDRAMVRGGGLRHARELRERHRDVLGHRDRQAPDLDAIRGQLLAARLERLQRMVGRQRGEAVAAAQRRRERSSRTGAMVRYLRRIRSITTASRIPLG